MQQFLKYRVFLYVSLICLPVTLVASANGNTSHCQNGIDALSRIEAEDFDYTLGVGASNNVDGMNFVAHIQQGDVMGFFNVNFHDGVNGIRMRVALQDLHNNSNKVHLHLDSIKNPPFVTIDIGNTGEWHNYVTLSLFLPHIPTGKHDLYFTFTFTNQVPPSSGIVDIDWFEFYLRMPK